MARAKEVLAYDLEGNYLTSYKSASEAGKTLGISRQQIQRVCVGKDHREDKYMFSYVREDKLPPHPSKKPFEVCKADNCYAISEFRNPQYCLRHYHQVRDFGRVLKRSRQEPNGYDIDYDNNIAMVYYYGQIDSENPEGHFLIDLEDFEFVGRFTWARLDNGREGYIYRRVPLNGKMTSVYLHRELMELTHENLVVDHINGNGLDNRKSNLRVVTQQGNSRNRRDSPKNYYYDKNNRKWIVNLTINNKTVYFGSFKSEEEAKNRSNDLREEYYPIKEYRKGEY